MASTEISCTDTDDFKTRIKAFYRNKGIAWDYYPKIQGTRINLEKLYTLVQSFGGSTKITETNKWADIANTYGYSRTCVNASFVIKQIYSKYLESFEKFEKGENNMDDMSDADIVARSNHNQNIFTKINTVPTHLKSRVNLHIKPSPLIITDKLKLALVSELPNETYWALDILRTLAVNECAINEAQQHYLTTGGLQGVQSQLTALLNTPESKIAQKFLLSLYKSAKTWTSNHFRPASSHAAPYSFLQSGLHPHEFIKSLINLVFYQHTDDEDDNDNFHEIHRFSRCSENAKIWTNHLRNGLCRKLYFSDCSDEVNEEKCMNVPLPPDHFGGSQWNRDKDWRTKLRLILEIFLNWSYIPGNSAILVKNNHFLRFIIHVINLRDMSGDKRRGLDIFANVSKYFDLKQLPKDLRHLFFDQLQIGTLSTERYELIRTLEVLGVVLINPTTIEDNVYALAHNLPQCIYPRMCQLLTLYCDIVLLCRSLETIYQLTYYGPTVDIAKRTTNILSKFDNSSFCDKFVEQPGLIKILINLMTYRASLKSLFTEDQKSSSQQLPQYCPQPLILAEPPSCLVKPNNRQVVVGHLDHQANNSFSVPSAFNNHNVGIKKPPYLAQCPGMTSSQTTPSAAPFPTNSKIPLISNFLTLGSNANNVAALKRKGLGGSGSQLNETNGAHLMSLDDNSYSSAIKRCHYVSYAGTPPQNLSPSSMVKGGGNLKIVYATPMHASPTSNPEHFQAARFAERWFRAYYETDLASITPRAEMLNCYYTYGKRYFRETFKPLKYTSLCNCIKRSFPRAIIDRRTRENGQLQVLLEGIRKRPVPLLLEHVPQLTPKEYLPAGHKSIMMFGGSHENTPRNQAALGRSRKSCSRKRKKGDGPGLDSNEQRDISCNNLPNDLQTFPFGDLKSAKMAGKTTEVAKCPPPLQSLGLVASLLKEGQNTFPDLDLKMITTSSSQNTTLLSAEDNPITSTPTPYDSIVVTQQQPLKPIPLSPLPSPSNLTTNFTTVKVEYSTASNQSFPSPTSSSKSISSANKSLVSERLLWTTPTNREILLRAGYRHNSKNGAKKQLSSVPPSYSHSSPHIDGGDTIPPSPLLVPLPPPDNCEKDYYTNHRVKREYEEEEEDVWEGEEAKSTSSTPIGCGLDKYKHLSHHSPEFLHHHDFSPPSNNPNSTFSNHSSSTTTPVASAAATPIKYTASRFPPASAALLVNNRKNFHHAMMTPPMRKMAKLSQTYPPYFTAYHHHHLHRKKRLGRPKGTFGPKKRELIQSLHANPNVDINAIDFRAIRAKYPRKSRSHKSLPSSSSTTTIDGTAIIKQQYGEEFLDYSTPFFSTNSHTQEHQWVDLDNNQINNNNNHRPSFIFPESIPQITQICSSQPTFFSFDSSHQSLSGSGGQLVMKPPPPSSPALLLKKNPPHSLTSLLADFESSSVALVAAAQIISSEPSITTATTTSLSTHINNTNVEGESPLLCARLLNYDTPAQLLFNTARQGCGNFLNVTNCHNEPQPNNCLLLPHNTAQVMPIVPPLSSPPTTTQPPASSHQRVFANSPVIPSNFLPATASAFLTQESGCKDNNVDNNFMGTVETVFLPTSSAQSSSSPSLSITTRPPFSTNNIPLGIETETLEFTKPEQAIEKGNINGEIFDSLRFEVKTRSAEDNELSKDNFTPNVSSSLCNRGTLSQHEIFPKSNIPNLQLPSPPTNFNGLQADSSHDANLLTHNFQSASDETSQNLAIKSSKSNHNNYPMPHHQEPCITTNGDIKDQSPRPTTPLTTLDQAAESPYTDNNTKMTTTTNNDKTLSSNELSHGTTTTLNGLKRSAYQNFIEIYNDLSAVFSLGSSPSLLSAEKDHESHLSTDETIPSTISSCNIPSTHNDDERTTEEICSESVHKLSSSGGGDPIPKENLLESTNKLLCDLIDKDITMRSSISIIPHSPLITSQTENSLNTFKLLNPPPSSQISSPTMQLKIAYHDNEDYHVEDKVKTEDKSKVTINKPPLPVIDSDVSTVTGFNCGWLDCNFSSTKLNSVFSHAYFQHISQKFYCLWNPCHMLEPSKQIYRTKYSLFTHIQEYHFSPQNTHLMVTAIIPKSENEKVDVNITESNDENLSSESKPSSSNISSSISNIIVQEANKTSEAATFSRKPDHTAIHTIYKFFNLSVASSYQQSLDLLIPDNPAALSINILAALILRNIAKYSDEGKRKIMLYESQITSILSFNHDISWAISQLLWELSK